MLMSGLPSTVWGDRVTLTHPQAGTLVKNAAVNTGVQVPQDPAFGYFGSVPGRDGEAAIWCGAATLFSAAAAPLGSAPDSARGPSPPRPRQHLFPAFLTAAGRPNGCEVLTGVSSVIDDGENLFMSRSAIWMSFEKCLLKSFADV